MVPRRLEHECNVFDWNLLGWRATCRSREWTQRRSGGFLNLTRGCLWVWLSGHMGHVPREDRCGGDGGWNRCYGWSRVRDGRDSRRGWDVVTLRSRSRVPTQGLVTLGHKKFSYCPQEIPLVVFWPYIDRLFIVKWLLCSFIGHWISIMCVLFYTPRSLHFNMSKTTVDGIMC